MEEKKAMDEKNRAIKVKGVTKIYRLYDKPIDRLKEAMSVTHKNYHKDFYALNAISFDVGRGETVGIIGTNGSGKSTVLKIITGVLTPTTGEVSVSGVISALLELGAGFNMDYTGIENIYMNGTMMGFSKKEMEAKLPDILEFADIGDFVHQPVKTYSSGMFVRLAFALAINVEPEILIVDEALSVGDVFFQAKCYRRMEEIRKNGTTILMVTHDMGAIIKYCDRVVVLNRGNFIAQGRPGKMVDLYKKILANQMDRVDEELERLRNQERDDFFRETAEVKSDSESAARPDQAAESRKDTANRTGQGTTAKGAAAASGGAGEGAAAASGGAGEDAAAASGGAGEDAAAASAGAGRGRLAGLMKDQLTVNPLKTEYGDGRAEIVDFGLFDERGNLTNLLLKGEVFTIKERIRFHTGLGAPIFTYTIKDKRGADLTGTNTMYESADVKPVEDGDEYEVEFRQRMTLQGGEYLLSMSCTGFENGEHVVYHRLYDIASITVISNKNTVGVYDMESQVTVAFHGAGKR